MIFSYKLIYTDLMLILIYRDKMRAEGPNHYPYTLGMALNEHKINTEAHYLF